MTPHNVGPARALPRDAAKEWLIVRKMAPFLPGMIPEDFIALLELGPPCAAGELIPGAWLSTLFLGQCIKWPCAVREFFAQIRRAAGATSPPTLTAATFVDAWRSTLLWCSGHEWTDMFGQMNQGRMDAISGLAL